MEETANFYTEAEYLEYDLHSELKNEYINGKVIPKIGCSEKHNIININLAGILGNKLKGKLFQVYLSSMRIKVKTTGLYAYPDILVVSSEIEFSGDKPDTLLNPVVIIEILSDSTESTDRGAKFSHYRQIPSLREYVLVSQNSQKIEKYHLNASSKWELEETTEEIRQIELHSIDCVMKLEEVYDKT